MSKRILVGASILVLCLPLQLNAAEIVPDDGLQAEIKEQWDEAAKIYRQSLNTNPAQAHLWERLADVQARRGDTRATADALRQAVKYSPNSPQLQQKLSQALAMSNEPQAALDAINQAVQMEPKNVGSLRARAELATWAGDRTAERDSYMRILALVPGDEAAVLGLARSMARSGDSDNAIARYESYLSLHPESQAAWMEYAVFTAEQGNFAYASELLEKYRQRFGETPAYLKQKARVMAWAGRPNRALAIISGVPSGTPDDYDLAYSRTVALAGAHRPRAALASLDDLTRIRPDSKDNANVKRVIRTPLRSNVNITLGQRASSDQISISNVGLDGTYVISPETRIYAGTDNQCLHSIAGSGLELLSGTVDTTYSRGWVGARYLSSPQVLFDAQVGRDTSVTGQRLIYEVGAKLWPHDELSLQVARRQDMYAVSPRALSWGVQRQANTLNAQWTPGLRYTIDGGFAYDTFSDGNSRSEVYVAPRRAVVRNQNLTLDIGLSTRWFGFKQAMSHGYYAPTQYQRYAAIAYGYWKLNDDNGISLAASYGSFKDNTMPGYQMGGDLVIEGVFGVYRDYMLNIKSSLMSNSSGAGTAGYRARFFEVTLTKRFD